MDSYCVKSRKDALVKCVFSSRLRCAPVSQHLLIIFLSHAAAAVTVTAMTTGTHVLRCTPLPFPVRPPVCARAHTHTPNVCAPETHPGERAGIRRRQTTPARGVK